MPMLKKWIWSDADYDGMGWHDATVRAVAFTGAFEFSLDIDYIYKWEAAGEGDVHFRFWVAPTTLAFQNVHALSLDLDFEFNSQIDELTRSDPRVPRNAEFTGKDTEWTWSIDIHGGSITFRSTGFTQYCRSLPAVTPHQSLDIKERGGLSFDKVTGESVAS